MSPFWQSRIYNVIAKYGLKVNEKKTKTFVPGTRREVTGVVVSDKINVPRSYIKQLRVLLHLWEKYGYAQAQIIFTRDFCKDMEKNLVNVIDGKINYLAMIKGKDALLIVSSKAGSNVFSGKKNKVLTKYKRLYEYTLFTRTFLVRTVQHRKKTSEVTSG